MAVEIKIPSAGESITQVQIADWRKNVGDYVQRDETVFEVETDKAAMEVPAPSAGVLKEIRKRAGETAEVGEVVAIIDETAAAPAGAAKSAAAGASTATPAAAVQAKASTAKPSDVSRPAAAAATAGGSRSNGDEPRIMPAARRMLSEHGLAPADVKPTGPGGRMLKEDVQRALDSGGRGQGDGSMSGEHAMVMGDRSEEAVPMTMLRRTIAARLVESQNTAALLTTFNEIDMSEVLALRNAWGDSFQKKYGVKLGFMSFFAKAAIDALRLIPQVNAEIRDVQGADGKSTPHIVYKHYYDLGVAVSTERGLVVPVVRNAERMSFAEIEIAIGELANRARDRKLSIDDLQGGTFTISNGGIYGSLMSTPIINPPQSAILGLHAIQERPVARDGQVVIRPMMYVALTYDHRIIDGKESVTFLKRIKECIEEPSRMLIEV